MMNSWMPANSLNPIFWSRCSKSEDTSSSNSQLMDYYKDEMVQQIASDSTEQNSLGLAQMLYEQMKRNYNLE